MRGGKTPRRRHAMASSAPFLHPGGGTRPSKSTPEIPYPAGCSLAVIRARAGPGGIGQIGPLPA